MLHLFISMNQAISFQHSKRLYLIFSNADGFVFLSLDH